MISLQKILNQKDEESSLSAEQSFTLQDILQQPDELIDDNILEGNVVIDDYDSMFEDSEEQQNQEQKQKQQVIQIKQQPIIVKTQEAQKKVQILSQRSSLKTQNNVIIKKDIIKYRRLKDFQMPNIKKINNITFSILRNVTSLFFNSQNNTIGIPTVIASSRSKLAIGTSLGMTVIFEGIPGKGPKILGTKQHQKYGPVTALSISKDNKYMIVGQQNCLLSVWDLYNYNQVKKQLVGKNKIIKLTFVTQIQFILNDNQGNIFFYTIQKFMWVNLKSQRIMDKSQLAYYDIKSHILQSNIHIVALCTIDHVYIFSIKPTVFFIQKFTKPEYLYSSKIPNIQLGRCALFYISNTQNTKQKKFHDIICISWSNSIFLYKFNDIGKSQKENVQLIYNFQQPHPIYNMQFMSEGILLTLDNRQTFRTFRVWIKNGNGGHQLLHQNQVPQEIHYQRFIKDKNNKYIKSFNNTLISSQFRQKQKQIFFISKNSVCRCRIHHWKKVIEDLINQEKQYLAALRISLQIYQNKLNIFIETFQNNQKSQKNLCQVGQQYLKAKIKQINKLNEDRVKNPYDLHTIKYVQQQLSQAYQILIQYMTEIKSQQYIFRQIYIKYIDNDKYRQKFFDCLQIFIQQGLIKAIPSIGLFKQITQFFIKKNKKNVVDNLIMFLDVKYMPYQQAIDICMTHKLLKALAYVCSIHGQYIPPLNKILEEIKFAQKNQIKSAKEIYYSILKDYIVNLLACKYINGYQIQSNLQNMKKTLSTWLTCSETFKYFTQNGEQSYQKDYFTFLYSIIQNLCDQKELSQYIHNILKQLIKQKCKEKQLAQLFIKINLIITLDNQEVSIIINYSQKEIIQDNLYEYLIFMHQYIHTLQKQPKIQQFIKKNKQIYYFYKIIINNKQNSQNILQQSRILQQNNLTLNHQLTKYIFSKLDSDKIAQYIQDLLKIHLENTMIYMLQKLQIEIVNKSIMNIKDQEYRYIILRKLLKKMRKQQRKNNESNKKHKKSKKVRIFNKNSYQSETQQQISNKSTTDINLTYKQLGNSVLEFYIKCLCLYKKQKRVFYEFVYYLQDYTNNIENIVKILQPYKLYSSLGLLQQKRRNYKQAFLHFQKVYNQYFFQQNYKKLKKAKYCHGRFMRRIFERMLFISQIINNQEQWILLLVAILSPLQVNSKEHGKVCDFIQNVFTKKSDHPFLLQLGQILEHCLTNVSNHVPMPIISQFISKHKQIFAYEFVLSSFRSTLVTYSKNSQFYKLTNQMMKKDQINQFDSFYNQKIHGVVPQYLCQKCGKPFNLDEVMKIYRCGHTYHEQCKTKFLKSLQNEDDVPQQQQDRCQKCLSIKTGGDQNNKHSHNLPDFHNQNENILMKGVKGMMNIIPSMMSVIPNPINIFTTKNAQEKAKSQRHSQFEEDQVFQFIAFEDMLQQKQVAYTQFIRNYANQLDKY